MKKLLVVLLLTVQAVYGQKKSIFRLDSMIAALPRMKEDTGKLIAIKNIFNGLRENDQDRAITFAQQGLQLAQKLHHANYTCLFYDFIGEEELVKADFKNALAQFLAQIKVSEKSGNKHYTANALTDIGLTYELQGDYSNAQDYFFRCLSVAEQMNDSHLIDVADINICVVFLNQNNYAKTIEYANKALGLVKKQHTDEPAIASKAYELMGSAYVGAKKYQLAQQYYIDALKIYQSKNSDVGIATMYSLLVTANPDDHRIQLDYGLKAEKLWSKLAPGNLYALNNDGNIGVVYGQMARGISRHDNPDSLRLNKEIYLQKALQYLNRALTLARQNNSRQDEEELADSLATVENFAGKYQQAFNHLKIHQLVADSMFSQESKNKIAGLEETHEIALRDKQLQINKLQIANQRRRTTLLIVCLIFLLCISGLIYLQSRNRKRTNAALHQLNNQLDEANKIKTQFFSILNHDLRYPVASFVNFLHLQQREPALLTEEGKAEHAKRITTSAENLLETMEDLLLWSKGQMENFEPQIKNVLVEELFDHIRKVFEESGITMSFELPPGFSLQTDEHYIKTIMHNLTSNAVKALSYTSHPLILWRAWENGGTKYLSITDNGPGATKVQLRALYDDSQAIGIKNGLGLHIVRDLAKAIHCQIKVNTDQKQGVEIELEFN